MVISLCKTTQFLITTSYHKTPIKLYPIPLINLQSQFLFPTYIPLLRCCYSVNKVDYFVTKRPNYRNCTKRLKVRASVKETPYQVLGVSSTATPNDIKRAYRKLALKYHPDVNKEANAQEKFMRIKHAYNTLLNSDSRKRYDSRSRNSDPSYYTTGRTRGTQDQEEFYGFGELLRDAQSTLGDFFKDLQEEFQNWEASASSQGKPKSLWEELADIGEELVEFLEKELNITDEDTEAKQPKRDSFEGFKGQKGNNVDSEGDYGNGIKESIDEIEATLAKLKKELGL